MILMVNVSAENGLMLCGSIVLHVARDWSVNE